MRSKRPPFRWTSCRLLLLVFIGYFVVRGIRSRPPGKPLPEICTKIINEKQEFFQSSKSGVQCKESSNLKAKWKGRGPRPENEYDVQEFMFRSKHTNSAQEDVTVAVQLSMDRLSHLERLGNSWQGPVSASVYIPHPRTSTKGKALISELSDFHESVDAKGIFSLDLGVVFALEGIEKMNPAMSDFVEFNKVSVAELYRYMYPVNVGRNVALAQVQTDLTLLLDVDFVVSRHARNAALGANPYWSNVMCEIRRRLPLNRGMFAVFPAFESGKGRAPPTDKNSLIANYRQGFVRRMSGNLITHCPTDYQYWMRSDHDYVIQYGNFFEPYGIAATEAIPWFPEDFKGYHLNKIMIYFAMAAKGWDFVVLPDHFVVHVWHPPSQSRNLTLGNPAIMKHIHKYKDDYVMDLAKGVDTCGPEIVNEALKPHGERDLKGEDIKPEPVGLIDDIHKFHEVPCTQLTGMGRRKMLFH
ncbi:hypothetical protein BSKO_12305 [Bryopsis sp. KO-2023]|nr:hypothetical protein BSKO_12305 [Bryopsis sp. KO-2023]